MYINYDRWGNFLRKPPRVPGGRPTAEAGVEAIATRGRRPRDFTELETVVTDRAGESIRFGTSMGLEPYRALVEDVVRHAPYARREGLTDQLLAEAHRPPPRR